jgi:hypothetical protein
VRTPTVTPDGPSFFFQWDGVLQRVDLSVVLQR